MDAKPHRIPTFRHDWRFIAGTALAVACAGLVTTAILTFQFGSLDENGTFNVMFFGCAAAVAAMPLLLSAAGVRHAVVISGVAMLVAAGLLIGAMILVIGTQQSSLAGITLWHASLATGTSAFLLLAADAVVTVGRFVGRHLHFHRPAGRSTGATA